MWNCGRNFDYDMPECAGEGCGLRGCADHITECDGCSEAYCERHWKSCEICQSIETEFCAVHLKEHMDEEHAK